MSHSRDRGEIVFGNAQTLIAEAQIHPNWRNWRNYLYAYAISGASAYYLVPKQVLV